VSPLARQIPPPLALGAWVTDTKKPDEFSSGFFDVFWLPDLDSKPGTCRLTLRSSISISGTQLFGPFEVIAAVYLEWFPKRG
jgi:hypothetical protein